jgi:lipopolysaccharide/colanic/teichoic acid biosynthesis glycosyltransferase
MAYRESWHWKKRAFDLLVCLVSSPLWLPVLAFGALLIACFEGRPIFYVSLRRVFRDQSIRLMKFRTMVRNADKLANRDTVPVEGVRFLNLPRDSPLYSRTGRWIERFHLTELPQILHIITGDMTFIGNRPLPANVVDCLRAEFPRAEDRFLVKGGLTGPVQLVGRTKLSDEERLRMESEYCDLCSRSYSVLLDFAILSRTVLSCLGIQRFLRPDEVFALLARHTVTAPVGRFEGVGGALPRRWLGKRTVP